MISRRTFLGAMSLLPVPHILGAESVPNGATDPLSSHADPPEDVTQYVKISIGTGGHGHTYPGASVPFGMVQLSPDTFNKGWDWCSGYHYSDSSIMGFSHTHLSGTGASDMLDVLLMPGTGPVKIFPGERGNPGEGYRSRFSHEDEILEPGYYAVLLRDYGIRAELSATERAGIHKYTFPKSESSHFILDFTHRYNDDGPGILSSHLKVLGRDTLVGGRTVQGWAPGRQIYFAMKFSRPFESYELLSDDRSLGASIQEASGTSLKWLAHYQTGENEFIYVKTGLSGVSVEGAIKNLEAEIPEWNFDAVRHSARQSWQRSLSRIRVESSSRRRKEIFYTGLYHTMLAPTLFDDVDGKYRGMDDKVHQLPDGFHNYSTFSLWDTYRATHPLYILFQRERVPDFVNCLIRMAVESPAGMPVWPLQGRETGCMTGYHSSIVIAEASVKGVQNLDLKSVYPAMRRRAMADDYRGLADYRRLGYIPCDKEEESVSKTIEYVHDDWAIAHVAKALGQTDDYKALLRRSQNYRNLFDSNTLFIRPRLESGAWAEPFNPTEMGHSEKWRDYTESNPWETTFAIQHDPKGCVELFGGPQAFVKKLDELFTCDSKLPPDAPSDIAGMVGQYAHGNEPCHHIAYLYAYAGVPYKTQERVWSLLELEYDNQPDGLAGNEDCGQMSAWYVMSALGFYSVDPVSGNYVLGTPLFDRAEVDLGDGKRLVVEAIRRSPGDKYIQSVTFNGSPHEKAWFSHSDIANGATIVFTMASTPNEKFGSQETTLPPSFVS